MAEEMAASGAESIKLDIEAMNQAGIVEPSAMLQM